MKIIHVTDGYLPRLGGIELHVGERVRRQRAAGHDARIATLTQAAPDVADPGWVARAPFVGDQGPSLRDADVWARRLANDSGADVMHIHSSVLSPLAMMTARHAARAGVPTVITVHSLWSNLGPLPIPIARAVGAHTWPVVWSAVSTRAAETVRDVVGSNVRVLPNAVETDAWRPLGAMAPAKCPTIVSVMRLTTVKRTIPLAGILADVRDRIGDLPMQALILGDGPRRKAFERRLARYGLTEQVQVLGSADRAAVGSVLQRGSVFLAPAERESFGIAALEARTAGLPIVASSRSGVGEFITHGVEGLLGDTDRDIAGHVAALLTDDALRSRIAEHNRTQPSGFDWARTNAIADDLYDLARQRVGAAFSEVA